MDVKTGYRQYCCRQHASDPAAGKDTKPVNRDNVADPEQRRRRA
jgi:hypothetical protein